MVVFNDNEILEQVRREGLRVPPISYLQRRFGLPYRRAAALQEQLAVEESAEESTLGPAA